MPLTRTAARLRASGRSAQETAALSTFSQSTGCFLASVGPFGIGLLRSATGGWALPWPYCSRSPRSSCSSDCA